MLNEIVEQYAKKILGFAYAKTHNTHQAEDLAQEILYELADSLQKGKSIENMDAFVYTISCHTWSNFLRRNKKHWHNQDVDLFHGLQSEQNVEEEFANAQLIEQLKTEIAYLVMLHRQITVLFYYESKSGAEISRLLNIPHATVRWHLSEIKKKLKVGIEMENLSYEPKKLMAVHDGRADGHMGQCGLGQDRLVDNICIACYGKALTIEEIARTLTVAAGYLEHHIKKLEYMDYLKVVDKNKYTTTFFISTQRHNLMAGKYHYHHIGSYADKIYTSFDKRYEEIKDIGFLGSDLDKSFVLWAIIPLALKTLYFESLNNVYDKNKIHIAYPKRKDGSEHWVYATLCDDEYYNTQTEFNADEVDFLRKSTGNGMKMISNATGLCALQYESRATMDAGYNWRAFSGHPDLSELYRIAEIIRNGAEPTTPDKQDIARQVDKGYISMENGKPKMEIPFFTKDEYDNLMVIIDDITSDLGQTFFVEYIEGFGEIFETTLPSTLSKEERAYHKYKIYPQYAVLYWLADKGCLRYPTKEEAKRLCTVVWCSQ